MTKIITAIDFSKCSIHALEYATALANSVEADVIMVWVDSAPSYESDFSRISREHRNEIKDEFDELVGKYQPLLQNGTLTYKLRKGKIYQEIANQARYDDASIIVAGSHGISGYERYWIGSNAYKIVSYAPCPVITIRLDYSFNNGIKKIVLPIDSTLETRQKVPLAVRMAKIFDSDIHVVGIYSTNVGAIHRIVDSYTEQVVKFIHEHRVPFVVEKLAVENVTNSLIQYAENVNADLISIMSEQETSASNIILGTYAQQMVNNSPVPVMTMKSREIMKIHIGNF